MSKFDMHKLSRRVCRTLSSSLAACPERHYHSGYKDLSIGVGVKVWAGSHAERHVTENFQPHPKKVSWQDKEVNTTKFQNLENLVLYLAFSYHEHVCVQVHIDVLVALLLDDLVLGLVGSRYS
jgi:hypothetical protein